MIYKDIIQKYKQKLEKELNTKQSEEQGIIYSRAYQLFKREQVGKLHSFYERACIFSEKLLIGVMMFGRPVARYEDQDTTLELTRMVLLPSPKNSESRSLSLAEKWIKHNTKFRRLIAYADSDRHQGTIYKAANWELIQIHHQTGRWNFRKRRRKNAGGDKLKFERKF